MPRVQSVDDSVFAAVNVYEPEGGQQHVEIYVRVEQGPEGAQMGLAIDGSNSMKEAFGAHLPPFLKTPESNTIQLVVKPLNTFLRGFSADGKTHIVYWAVGNGGAELEPVGVFDETADASLSIDGPRARPGEEEQSSPCGAILREGVRSRKWALVSSSQMVRSRTWTTLRRSAYSLVRRWVVPSAAMSSCNGGGGRLVNESQMDELNDMFEAAA